MLTRAERLLRATCIAGFVLFTQQPVGAADPTAALRLQTISVRFAVPDPGYVARIAEIRRVGDELWVRTEVHRRPGFSPQVIAEVEDTVTVRLPSLPVQHFITGKTWGWANSEPYRFLDEAQTASFLERFRSGEPWYVREEPKAPKPRTR